MKPRKAGRPTLKEDGEKMKRCNVMLDDMTIEVGKRLGKGNLSEGIRYAVLLIENQKLKAERKALIGR